MKLLDLSHWNTITDWGKIKEPVILKCTESLTYLDPTFKERREILRNKGLYLGCYHFFRDVDPIKQADFFLSHGHKEGELLILDFEINCSNPVEKCKQFLDRVGSKWLYTNDARALKYSWPSNWKFWIARYGNNDGTQSEEPNFKQWKIWQYTSRGIVDGINGYVDLNTQSDAISEPTGRITMYSQNDQLWKNVKMGNSSLTLGTDGCLVDSICTLASWFGDMITPRVMAKCNFLFTNPSYGKKGGLVIWNQLENLFEHIKFKARVRNFDENLIDEYLVKNPDTAVILNVDKGYHFVAALNKTQSGYRCVDSYPYPYKIRVYKKSDITGFCVLNKK